ncbi:MAG: DNA repair protein RecO [Bacteroidales bacterium]|nr:DNA repair protein RecO [Bacteroidales bacterium]
MYVSTRGFVLHTTKYSDTSIIVKLFTEMHGTQSFIVKNAFSKKKNIRASLFSPLALLNITYDDHYLNQIKYLKEVDLSEKSDFYSFDPAVTTIRMFYCELLYRLLFDAGEDPVLFHFIEKEIQRMTDPNTVLNILPLQFLIRLSVLLGFMPEDNYSTQNPYFSLQNGRFQSYLWDDNDTLSQEESLLLHQLLSEDTLNSSRQARLELLHHLIHYFQIHNEQVGNISSVDILTAVLH